MKSSTSMALAFATAVSGSLFLATPAAEAQNLSDRVNYVMNKRAQQQSQNQSKARMLSALLYTDLTLEFNETPARDAVNYLKTVLGIEIIGRWSDDRTGMGLDPEAPITMQVEQQNALTVLELVLAQAEDFEESAWQLRDGFVEVGTKNRLATRGAQELRYYPIRDLLFEPTMFDNAPSLDLDNALNQGGGNQGGGGGGGGGFGGGGSGGGGGGTGGGGSGGGGGSLFGDPADPPDRVSEAERAQQLIDLIVELVEPDGWDVNGGNWASVRYYSGTLIVRAPDFVHRQLGGYPFATRPVQQPRMVSAERRYVTFTGGMSHVSNASFKTSPSFGGATTVGGGGGGGGGETVEPGQPGRSDGQRDGQSNGQSGGK